MPTGPTSHRRILTIICLIVTAAVILLHLTNAQYDRTEQGGRDWLITNGKARRASRDSHIVFLTIDQASRTLDTVFTEDLEKSRALRLMKQGFPYPRETYAHIIERLADAGAKAIVFDVIFPGPKAGDELFAAALEKYRDRVVVGATLTSAIEEDHDGERNSGRLQYVPPSQTLIPQSKGDPRIGFVNVHPDQDNIVRQIFYRTTLGEFHHGVASGEELFSLSARALQQAGYGQSIPPGHQPLTFRYAEDFQPRSLYEIFVEPQWNAPPYNGGTLFRDKIVVVGASGLSSEDRLQTPFGVTTAPYIHLNAINAALHRDFITTATSSVDLALIVGMGALSWALGAYVRRPLLRLLFLGLAAVGYVQTVQWIADSGLLLVLFGPVVSLTVSGIVWSAWEQVLDRMERQRTRRALDRYVGHNVAREVMDNPQTYFKNLGGVRKPITTLFSDVRGFTTFTETADPEALVKQLNEYFGKMVDIVFAHEGTLDKFIGDAVMATWGSIEDGTPVGNADRALATALEMRQALHELNTDWTQRGMHEWQIGIGINHGEPIVGNIGSAGKFERFDLTVVGDAVNLASRLEGVTKKYHLDLCISETVAVLIRDRYRLRSVDLIIVKGKTKPVEIFTVLGKRGEESDPAWLVRHEEAMQLYRAGDFAAAEKIWREVLTQIPGDGLTEVMLDRCATLQISPPPPPWTGVYEMTSK